MTGRRTHSREPHSVFRTIVIAVLLLACPCGDLLANDAQARICRAAINFGQAEARTYLFGRAFQGSIPGDQLAFISTNLGNASAEIAAAEALFGRPFSTEPSRMQAVARLIADINGFTATAAGLSYSHQAAKIQNLAGRYLSTLQSTFVSSRPDAFQYNSTCDSLLFNACYFYGKATIASAFDDDRSHFFESGAMSTFRTSIRDGLAIAMDGAGHTLPDGHARKICCTFGSPAAWEAMSPLQTGNSMETYATMQRVLLGIIGNADALDRICASSDSILCGSSPRAPAPPPESGSGGRLGAGPATGVTGEWFCRGFTVPGTTVTVGKDGRGGATVTMKVPMVAIEPGDPTGYVNHYNGSVSGGNVQWEYTGSSGSSSSVSRVNLSLSPDGRNLMGTVAWVTTSSWTGTSSGATDISCGRISAPDTSAAQVPGPDRSSDVDASADFFDAAAAAQQPVTTPTREPVARPGERRWVLVQTLVNPKNAPTESVDHSARFAGSYERWTITETSMSYSTRSEDHGSLWYDINLSVAFTKPPAQLIPGETVNLSATFSHGGSLNRGNPGIRFEYRGEGINLGGVRTQAYYPWAPEFEGPGAVSASFVVPQAGDGEIKLHAFLWNHAPCDVTWIYRAQ